MTDYQFKYIQDNLVTNDTSGGGLRLKVDLDGSSVTVSENIAQVGGNTVTAGAGAVAAGTMRITLASDDPAVVALQLIDNAVSGAGFNITQFGGTNVATGSGNTTGALRVELANNGTGRMATLDTLTSGNVGGFTTLVQSTVVMSVAGAYATGDYMGTSTTPQSFSSAVRTSGGTGIIKSLLISDKITNTNVAMELWILDRTFTAPTDNAAWDLSDTDMLFVQAVIPISTAGWYASSVGQVYFDGALAYPIKSNGTTLFYALVARGTTPAFTSADLTITLGILQD